MCIDCKTYQNYLEKLFGTKLGPGEVKEIFHGPENKTERMGTSYVERQRTSRWGDEPPAPSMSMVPVAPKPPILVSGYEQDIPMYEERSLVSY
jgi:hypothetical protein